mgnify:CR=1 FL=1
MGISLLIAKLYKTNLLKYKPNNLPDKYKITSFISNMYGYSLIKIGSPVMLLNI